jgi:DNA (cytosine-5)-methyltransferase 1
MSGNNRGVKVGEGLSTRGGMASVVSDGSQEGGTTSRLPSAPSKKPRLLDLFCGAGGCGMGYHRAGFEVVGVDIEPQPNYPFEFHQADAMEFPLDGFDAIHASPPCQGYSRLRHLPWLKDREYPMLIDPTRERLKAARVPWVIENVVDAPLTGFVLCGAALGLTLSRHRRFESSELMLAPQCPGHKTIPPGAATLGKRYRHSAGVTGVSKEISRDSIAGHFAGVDRARVAMDIPWMKRDELAQAVPPAYTEWIGTQLLASLGAAA